MQRCQSVLRLIMTWSLFLMMSACVDPKGPDSIVNPTSTTESVKTGCYHASYNGLSQSQIGCGLINSFGDFNLDQAFTQEIQAQAQFWSPYPTTIYVFDECQGVMNALSSPQGYILFGRNLTFNVLYTTGDFLGIAGVLAHEYAHQMQFRNGWMSNTDPTVRATELEADAFSGYYMALAYGWAWNRVNSFFQVLFDGGSYDFHNPGFHGTPQERVASGRLGWDYGLDALQRGRGYTEAELHNVFRQAIGKTILKQDATVKQDLELSREENLTLQRIQATIADMMATGDFDTAPLMPDADLDTRRALWPATLAILHQGEDQ